MDPGYMHYSSVTDHKDEARVEIQRLVDLGAGVRIPLDQARAMFSGGSISKLACLSKTKDD
eukprot:2627705-Amphidinium_carterae.1